MDVTPASGGVFTLKGRYLYASRLSQLTGSSATLLSQLCQAMGLYSDGSGTRVWWRSHHTQARTEALASAIAGGHRDIRCVMHVENQNGKKIILHKLDPKDNYYSIGRRYNIKPNVIIQYNNNAALRIGGIIKVPTDLPFDGQAAAAQTVTTQQPVQQTAPPKKTETAPPVVQPTVQERPATPQQVASQGPQTPNKTGVKDPGVQEYKVSAGETLFAIAKRFNTTPEAITKLNGLTSNYLSPGQVLRVQSNTPAPPPVVDTEIVATQDSTLPDSTDTNSVRPNRFGLFEKNEKGMATWIDDTSLDPNKKLVLHRTAPIGTVIKIINPMTNRTTFAKVVGRFTENEATKDVIIVLTKNVAESLGALDKRFHVILSYGTPNE
ncbi:MAG: LysM peptidoglycan-binding domain-containing protein [Sphingobacteriales bacterium]|nr:MAG: LysM peptidoglycan-binding domain-containing protein [Sphingobacteriales bacterium]